MRSQLHYYPTVTREPFGNQGRLTDLSRAASCARTSGCPARCRHDRVMICGSPSLLKDLATLLEARGFNEGSGEARAST